MSDFLQRLYKIAGTTNQSEIARHLGIPNTTLSNWVSRGVSKGGALKISKAYGVNIDYVLTGEGEAPIAKTPKLASNISSNFMPIEDWDDDTPLEADEIEVPFYKDFGVACGYGSEGVAMSDEWRRLRMSRRTVERIGSYRDKIFATLADGDSMSPTINDGDTIWIDQSKTSIKDGKVFVFEYGGLYMCKRLYRLPNNRLRVVSDNSSYPEFEIEIDENFRLIGWVWHWSVMERW